MGELWTEDVIAPEFPTLRGNAKTDVLVIGGGMAGILCAHRLQELGANYLLVDAGRIGNGITRRTTAVLSAQHSTLYQDMIRKRGAEVARLYLAANVAAVSRFRTLSETIPCDFEEVPSILYSLRDRERMAREAKAVQSLGFPAEFLDAAPLPHAIAGAVRFPGMAQFHPLKFLYGIAKNLNIRENTPVEDIRSGVALTPRGSIRARRIIVATHFPIINRHGLYFMKLYQRRSFVIALEGAPKLDCTLEDVSESGIYLRSYGDLLLVGGGDARTGKQGDGFRAPRSFARKYYPHARECYAWGNQDCIPLDGIPYIGRYSLGFGEVLTATGFNAWGMTTSMVASQLLADQALGRKNPLTRVYNPSRSMLSGQLFLNLGETMRNLATPGKKRCTHMGCSLCWNEAEQSYDCPCHGSRFARDGTCIENPAKKNLK